MTRVRFTPPIISASEYLLQVWPVSKRVNRLGNDEDVSLVDPIEATAFEEATTEASLGRDRPVMI
jgi:hypothetical protein